MNLIRWEPFPEITGLTVAFDSLFQDTFVRPELLPGKEDGLPLDIYHTPHEMVVKAALPGVGHDDIEITVAGDVLTLKGETREEKKAEKGDYIVRQMRYGSFGRSVTLPPGLQPEKAEAVLKDGVLTLTIPKIEEAKTTTIKVKASTGEPEGEGGSQAEAK
ncbi:MAG: Hsp20/alpha crystallin family protein [Chloroflexi bacterium]|nr:Hsp20/alpha crystallin family protein [Chloroflexota bacterium]